MIKGAACVATDVNEFIEKNPGDFNPTPTYSNISRASGSTDRHPDQRRTELPAAEVCCGSSPEGVEGSAVDAGVEVDKAAPTPSA